MSTPRRPDQLTDLQLEQIALGEATPAQPLTAEQQAQIEALRRSSAEILARYPAGPQAEQIAARLAKAQAAPQRARIPVWLPALAGAATVLAVVVWTGRDRSQHPIDPRSGGDTIVAKGGAAATSLRLYRQAGSQIEPLASGANAQSGDLVQLALVPGPARYGVLLSIDGRGGVTLHLPASDGEPAEISDGSGPSSERAELRLPRAFRLDDAPSFERFFLVTADAAHRDQLRVSEVLERARRLAADRARAPSAELPDLAPGLAQQSLILRKDAR